MGVAIAVVVDLLLPLVLVAVVGVRNVRSHTSRTSEAVFWLLVAVCEIWLILGVVVAVWRDIPQYAGTTVLIDAVLALPLSAIPATVNSTTIHLFYTAREWAETGYLTIVPIFTVGLVPWGILGPMLLRRVVQHRRSRRPAAEEPAV